VIVEVLPWSIALSKGAELKISKSRVFGGALVVIGFATRGAIIAYLMGDATVARRAIAYGAAWEGLAGGILQGTVIAGTHPKPGGAPVPSGSGLAFRELLVLQ